MPRQSATTSKSSGSALPKASGKPYAGSGNSACETERFQMISEAAYYYALGRGFNGGDPVEDWLKAEEEIDCMLRH